MTTKARFAATVAAAFLLSACGAGTVSSLPGAPPTAPSHGSKHKVKATIRISIPKHKHHRRIRIHGHYVSAATQSIAIAITPNGGSPTNYNADLTTANNPNCTASLISPLVCTISLTLAPGDYTATFATYDGLLTGEGGTTDPPSGNELSANQSATMKIVAGQQNNLDISLDGIPTGVLFVPAANSLMYGSMAIGFNAPKCGSAGPNQEKVSVIGTDADGGLIVGPGAPVATLDTADSTAMAVATPPPSSPNLFTLSHPISSTSQNPINLTATVTPAADTGSTTPISAQVMVGVSGGTQICGLITQYGVSFGSNPTQITVGPDNNLWFTEGCGGNIGKITTDGKVSEYHVAGAFPHGIVSGPDDALWFGDQVGSTIGEITTTGTVENQFPTGDSPGVGPSSIALGGDGNLWYTAVFNIGKIAPTGGSAHEYPVLNGYSAQSIISGPDGRLWFGEGNGIGASTTAGAVSEYTTGISVNGGASVITVGPDGKLWFTDPAVSKIGNITTDGTIHEFPALPTANAGPVGITTGPDNALWFTEQGANNIGRITTSGTVTEFPLPVAGSNPTGIVAGPDGAIWFVQCATAQIARLQ